MQQPLNRAARGLLAVLIGSAGLFSAGCYLTAKPASDDSPKVAEYRRRAAAAPKPLRFPARLAGAPASPEQDLAARPADAPESAFLRACAELGARECANRAYGEFLLQAAVMPDPPAAVGVAGRLAFGVERQGRKGPEWSESDAFALARRGHRVALATGPVDALNNRQRKALRRQLEKLVAPGGADAGLEFLQTWRRLGIDRSKVRYAAGFWDRPELKAFTTPIDAGELFYFESTQPAQLVAEVMAVREFEVAGGKRLIFATERHGEVQIILGADWVMGIQNIADPARAGMFLDSALYVPAEKRSSAPLTPLVDAETPGRTSY